MQTHAKEREDSQKIKLSKSVLESAGTGLNETLDVTISNSVKTFHHKTLEERTAEYDGKLMLDGEYDWYDPLGREIW